MLDILYAHYIQVHTPTPTHTRKHMHMQCGPCRIFTPKLIETYKKVKEAGKNFEVIFASSDKDEDEWKAYSDSMPWLSIPFGDRRIKTLSRMFEVQGNS